MRFHRLTIAIVIFSCRQAETPNVTIASATTDAAPAPVAIDDEPVSKEFPCAAFVGDGVTPDAAKARACLERVVQAQPCDGGSPSLERLELAASLADGAGGPADRARAKSLFAGCFADASVAEILAHVDGATAPYKSCDAFAMTTLASSACLAEHAANEDLWLKRVKRKLPPDRAALFASATKAHDAYATKVGSIAYMRYEGGTMRDPAMRSVIVAMLKRRRARLAKLFDDGSIPLAIDLAQAERNAKRALDSARSNAEGDVLTAINDANAAWPAYRDAELALYASYDHGARSAVLGVLEVEYFSDFCDAP